MKTNYRTSAAGYPRIGAGRELKFACEKYFASIISEEELRASAADIRKRNWLAQKNAGIDFISSNDFSFYDGMLDTAVMLGAIGGEYAALNLPKLGTYFAMARGYQGAAGDVRALPMKKWFNTNYHYLVPNIEGKPFQCDFSKALSEYEEAKTLGIETKITVIGPYTFLKLARAEGRTDIADCYRLLLGAATEKGAQWMQLDEPALVLDMERSDVELFRTLYETVLAGKNISVLLQTYFGHPADCYREIVSLPFDAVGLDFIEGSRNLRLIEEHGFPVDKILFAGIVNGKNIWRTDYEKARALAEKIESLCSPRETVIGTSCSLLHVPVSLAAETALPPSVKMHLAFAEEKLSELKEIASADEAAFERNRALFSAPRVQPDADVSKNVSALSEADFVRAPGFDEREKIQRKALNLPLLPTTTIGSFPQTKDVRANRAAFKKGTVSEDEYDDFCREKIRACIAFQEDAGLDVLVHGEFERNDMVEYFGEHLSGFVFTQNGWVQSYGTRCVKPPIVWSDISRKQPITVEWSVFAQSCTKKPVKGMLTGPVTILNWSFPREDISLAECAFQIALAIRGEVLDLEKNGIRIIQIDEAALKEKLPLRKEDWHSAYLDWAIRAFNLVHSRCRPGTQIHTHMCYSEFIPIIKDIDRMDADVITFEASRSNLEILQALKENGFRTQTGPGVYDIHSPRVPSVQEMREAVEKMAQYIPVEKLWVNPDCGLKTRGTEETEKSLRNMVESAHEARKILS